MTITLPKILIPASTTYHLQEDTAPLPLLSSGAQEHPPQTLPVVGQQDRNQRAFLRPFLILGLVLEVYALFSSSSSSAAASQQTFWFWKATSHVVGVILLVVVWISYFLSLARRLRSDQEESQQLVLCHQVLLFTTGLAMGYAVVWIARVGFESRIHCASISG
jgi:hypothetical protein